MCPWPRYICWLQTRPIIVSRKVVDWHIDCKLWCNIDHPPYWVLTTDIARVVSPPAHCQYLLWLLIELVYSLPFKFMNVLAEHCVTSHCICAFLYFPGAKYFIAIYFGTFSWKLLNMWDWLWTRDLTHAELSLSSTNVSTPLRTTEIVGKKRD